MYHLKLQDGAIDEFIICYKMSPNEEGQACGCEISVLRGIDALTSLDITLPNND